MAKMFYTTDEAAQKLGVSGDQLKTLVTENKLREFRDGAPRHVQGRPGRQARHRPQDRHVRGHQGRGVPGVRAIGLAGDSHAPDVISLADSTASPTAKDDTVVTGAKQQVFKPGEVKASDTVSKTTH